jgi:hypothetical protein
MGGIGGLHAHKVTHRGLTADRILLTGDGQAMLLDPGDGDMAASDLPIRLRLLTLVAAVAAAYLLAGELGRANLQSVLREADWRWTIVALALSAATYVGAGRRRSGSSPGG